MNHLMLIQVLSLIASWRFIIFALSFCVSIDVIANVVVLIEIRCHLLLRASKFAT